jgi:hypothetical protein
MLKGGAAVAALGIGDRRMRTHTYVILAALGVALCVAGRIDQPEGG